MPSLSSVLISPTPSNETFDIPRNQSTKHPDSGCIVDWFLGMSNVSFDGVGEISKELREGIVYYIQRKGILAA